MTRNTHSVQLSHQETTEIRGTILRAEEAGDLPPGFSRTGGTQDDPVKDWLVGKYGEAIFATFLRANFNVDTGIQLAFGDDFVPEEESDVLINGAEIEDLDVKTISPGFTASVVLEGVYQSHPTDDSFLYVFVALDDGQDVRKSFSISGTVLGVQTAENLTRVVEKGEDVTGYHDHWSYEADEKLRLVYPKEDGEIFRLSVEQWETGVLDTLDYPEIDGTETVLSWLD